MVSGRKSVASPTVEFWPWPYLVSLIFLFCFVNVLSAKNNVRCGCLSYLEEGLAQRKNVKFPWPQVGHRFPQYPHLTDGIPLHLVFHPQASRIIPFLLSPNTLPDLVLQLLPWEWISSGPSSFHLQRRSLAQPPSPGWRAAALFLGHASPGLL